MMTMKRSRDEFDALATLANYLMLFSPPPTCTLPPAKEKMFQCKTCNRRFPSFQALGGHRASHKKPRLHSADSDDNSCISGQDKPKKTTHQCSICGADFKLGQALGGHMRRHRPLLSAQSTMLSLSAVSKNLVNQAPEKDLRVNDDGLCLDLRLSL